MNENKESERKKSLNILCWNRTLLFQCQGTSLIATIIAMGIVGFLLSSMLSLFVLTQKEQKSSHQRLDGVILQYALLHILKNPQNCRCQFDNFKINVNKARSDEGDEIVLTEFKRSCGASLITEDQILTSGLKIESIRASHILATGTTDREYFGQLIVKYKAESTVRTLDFRIPLQFTTNGGPSVERDILLCGAGSDDLERIEKLEVDIPLTKYNLIGKINIFDSYHTGQIQNLKSRSDQKIQPIEIQMNKHSSIIPILTSHVVYLEAKDKYEKAEMELTAAKSELDSARNISCPPLSSTVCVPNPPPNEDSETCTTDYEDDTDCLNRKKSAISAAQTKMNTKETESNAAKDKMDSSKPTQPLPSLFSNF